MLNLEEDMKLINNLPRDKFEEFYMLLNDMLIDMPGMTVGTLEKIKSEPESMDDADRDFFSDEKLRKLLHTEQSVKYLDDESNTFIREVKASNVTDIADSGYFYKKICNCLDDIFIEKEDCGSEGIEFKVSDITETDFLFYIKEMYTVEFGEKFWENWSEFQRDTAGTDTLHVRTPLMCKLGSKRCFCRKCCGKINTGGRDITSKNIGFITALCTTESATQASLSSMNDGESENVNKILERKLPNMANWDDALKLIKERVDSIGYQNVQARWYFISLISRYVYDEAKQYWKATSYKTNSNYGEDLLGAYIFEHTQANLKKMINKGGFRLTSLKSKNLFGIY